MKGWDTLEIHFKAAKLCRVLPHARSCSVLKDSKEIVALVLCLMELVGFLPGHAELFLSTLEDNS